MCECSVSRGEGTETSDIDLLVDYNLQKVSAWFPGGLLMDLQDLLNSDDLVRDGVLRRLQTMAESTQRLSDDLKQTAPDAYIRRSANYLQNIHDKGRRGKYKAKTLSSKILCYSKSV